MCLSMNEIAYTQTLLIIIIAIDEDFHAFIKDTYKLNCIDDCGAFILTTLNETLNIKNEEIPAVVLLGSCSLRL